MFSIRVCVHCSNGHEGMFPSPLGDYVFNPDDPELMQAICDSFRPLSGIMFSIFAKTYHKLDTFKFPSPLGDYVFNRLLKEAENMTKLKFPSPLGDYVFNLTSFELALTIRLCFRPLSGIMFSIQKYVIKERKDNNVSVPSRGLCFQSISWQCGTTTHKKFPSPLGDYVFNRNGNTIY